jgi:hypothetical protein
MTAAEPGILQFCLSRDLIVERLQINLPMVWNESIEQSGLA